MSDSVPEEESAPLIDSTVPHQARVWNYFLGGKDNYPADREFAERMLQVQPQMRDLARHSRRFLGRAVRYMVESGIRQFLDIGTGLPTADNTHEVAQRMAPEARIVYVDNDPLVLVHAQALLTSSPEGATDYIDADVRDPDRILREAARTLRFTEPLALIIMGVMGAIPDDEQAYGLVRRFVDALPSGSHLIFTDGTRTVRPDAAEESKQLRAEEGYAYTLRTPDQIARFFDGLELLEPGVVSVSRWRPEATAWGLPDEVDAFCGVARKP